MRRTTLIPITTAALLAVAAVAILGTPTVASNKSKAKMMSGYEEVPPVDTAAEGEFRATVNGDGEDATIDYELTYTSPESPAQAAHIHFGQRGVNGGVVAFLCGGGDKPPCPATGGTVTGVIDAADVIGPAVQGIAAGEIQALIDAMREGVTYANVHTEARPGGEIRGQIK